VRTKKACCESKEWIEDRMKNLRILMNISRFPEPYARALENEKKLYRKMKMNDEVNYVQDFDKQKDN
jgi:hypothetical protein